MPVCMCVCVCACVGIGRSTSQEREAAKQECGEFVKGRSSVQEIVQGAGGLKRTREGERRAVQVGFNIW